MTWTGFIFLGRGMLPMLWGIAALTLYGTGALSGRRSAIRSSAGRR